MKESTFFLLRSASILLTFFAILYCVLRLLDFSGYYGYSNFIVQVLTLSQFLFELQVSLVIRGRYVPSFWIVNLEFAHKMSIFDQKIVIFDHF